MKITPEVKEFLQTHLVFLATVDSRGRPHMVPKATLAIVNENQVVFVDLRATQTRRNVLNNHHVAIVAIDPVDYRGYELRGKASVVDRGPQFKKIFSSIPVLSQYPKLRDIILVRINSVKPIKD